MLFEERPAQILIQRISEVVVQVEQPLLQYIALWSVANSLQEQLDEPRQRVLIHRIHNGHVSNGEIQNGSTVCNRSVLLTGGINLLFSCLRLLHLLRDVIRCHLRVSQGVDEGLVFENITLCVAHKLQDLVFEPLNFLLHGGTLHDKLVFHLLQIWSLFSNDETQQLVFQSIRCHSEVQKGHLHRGLRRVVRVTQLRRHVEPEVFVVRNGVLT
mmetsp:Transcript_19025/g.48612  ORF Transcript_19025/g.48612 Transcript_19025/m.48612 type:complete len:213 (+) Transcript_19025:3688-4326(+)